MAGTSSSESRKSDPQTKPTNTGKKAAPKNTSNELGAPHSNDAQTEYNKDSADQSPERLYEQLNDNGKVRISHADSAPIVISRVALRQISQNLVELGGKVDELIARDTSPVLQQVGSTRNSPDPCVQNPVEDVPTEPRSIAQLQKDAAATHAANISTLLHKFLPSPLLQPYPPPSKESPQSLNSIPSILDLEVRHAIASAPLQVYLNHISSKAAREEFLLHVARSEEQNFGHGSQVAKAMHQESVQAEEDDEKRLQMETKWNEKGRRRAERKIKLRMELGMGNGMGNGMEMKDMRLGLHSENENQDEGGSSTQDDDGTWISNQDVVVVGGNKTVNPPSSWNDGGKVADSVW